MEGEILRTRERRTLSLLDAGNQVIERPCAKLQASPCEQMPSAEYSRQNMKNATKSDQRCADLQGEGDTYLTLYRGFFSFS